LLDPKITIKPLKNQIDETIELCRGRVEKQERVLVTTLTKRTAEDLSDYLRDVGLKVRYLHSDIDTIERVEILRGLRAAGHDVVVFHVMDPSERDLPDIGIARLMDPETGDTFEVDTSSPNVRAAYSERVAAEREEREHLLRRLAIDEVAVRTEGGVVEPLLRFFRARETRVRR